MIEDEVITLQDVGFGNSEGSLIDKRFKISKKVWEDEMWIVYNGFDITDETEVIIRTYPCFSDLNQVRRDILFSEQVNHPTILSYKAWSLGNEKFGIDNYVVTEPIHLKPLVSGQQYSEKMIRLLFEQMLDSVDAMHAVGIYGLGLDQNSFAVNKLSYPKDGSYWIKFTGTPQLATANDITEEQRQYLECRDIAELGEILFMMITGCKPFHSRDQNDEMYNLITSDCEMFIKAHKVFHQILKENRITLGLADVVLTMLTATPRDYPTIDVIRKDIWMVATELPYSSFLVTVLEKF